MRREKHLLHTAAWLALTLGIVGLVLDRNAVTGLVRIMTEQDILLTDYLAIGGLGGALVNVSLMVLAAIGILTASGDAVHGFTLAELGLVAGFSFFGKNPMNSWPILLGTFLYAKCRREPFHRYAAVALLATALAPAVSWMMFGSRHHSLFLGAAVGLLIGFLLPILSAYTFKILNGMSLYNVGFACGLLAMMSVPILTAVGDRPEPVLICSEAYHTAMGVGLTVCSVACLVTGVALSGTRETLRRWRGILKTSGRAPCDWLRDFGLGPVLWNTGINGLLGVGYVLAAGGVFHGPAVGGVLTMMGFSASGKHLRNCLPVMVGVGLGALLLHQSPSAPGLLIAGLFGTTLAPLAGLFGWPAGLAAGFLHSAVVAQTSGPVAGMNLYNNGFAGGLIAIFLYPVLTAIRHRRPHLQNTDYLDVLEGEAQNADAD